MLNLKSENKNQSNLALKQQAVYASICRILERLPSTTFSMVTAVAIYYADFGAVERP